MSGERLELHLHLTHRHIPADISPFWSRSAAVCLQRHHQSPVLIEVTVNADDARPYQTEWETPTEDHLRALGYKDNTTEYGAYCVALAAAYARLGHMALARAEGGSGADWYLVPISDEGASPEYDLDRPDLVKLEVSGVDEGSTATLKRRLAEKVDQVSWKRSPAERYAVVVGFQLRQVWFERA